MTRKWQLGLRKTETKTEQALQCQGLLKLRDEKQNGHARQRLVWAGRQDWQAQSPARTRERDKSIGFAENEPCRRKTKRADTRAGRRVVACCIEWNGFLPGASHKKFIYPSSSTSIPRLVVCLVPSFFLFSFSEKPTTRACHANIQREKPKNNTKPNNLAKN